MDCILASVLLGIGIAVGLLEWQRHRRAQLRQQLLATTRRQAYRLTAALDALRSEEAPVDD